MKIPSQYFHINKIHRLKFKHIILNISILLLICMFLSVPASAVLSVVPYSGGSGTSGDPYLLSSDSDIYALSLTSADWDKYFVLTQNITLVGNHIPIGDGSTQFTGNFNGSGFAVKNLTVNQTTDYAGFFGKTGSGANIHDIGVEASSDGVVSTGVRVGVLVGFNYHGAVSNCFATGNATGSRYVGGLVGFNHHGAVSNSFATGNVAGSSSSVGGLVGYNDDTVSNCFATGNVTGSGNYVGGLVGFNNDTVSNSYATGNVTGSGNVTSTGSVGGLVGYNVDTVNNSFATGTVFGSYYVGGLVGYNVDTVSNSFATGTASGSSSVGGLVGRNTGTVNNSYYSGSPTDAAGTSTSYDNFTSFTFVSGSPGLNWNSGGNIITTEDNSSVIWKIDDGSSLPYFQCQDATTGPYSGGSGTVDDPYLLSSDSDIDTLSITSADWDKYFVLTQNITLVGNHTPIGNGSTQFIGNFNGSGFAVKNLTVYQTTDYAGFFGYAGSGANILDLGVETSSEGVFSTSNYAGGLVGRNSGTVSNSYATGIATGYSSVGVLAGYNYQGTVTNSFAIGNATGNATGSSSVGGLIGNNYQGTVTNSNASGNATGNNHVGGLVGYSYQGTVTNSYASSNATGNDYVGGLVGWNYKGTVTNSYASGNATGNNHVGGLVGDNSGTVSSSYATGIATGVSWVGGLVGYNSLTVSNSFATGNAIGSSNVGGLIGFNWATVSNSFATGNAAGVDRVGGLVGYNRGTVINSYATGNVTGSSSVGGLVGYNYVTVLNCFATGNAIGSSNIGGLVGYNDGTVSSTSYYSGSPATGAGTSTSFANFTRFTFVSESSGLNWNANGNNITTVDDSDFIWKIVDGYTHPYFQYQDLPSPLAPYVETISRSSGINNSAGSTSFWLNVTGSCFNITDPVGVNLTMNGQTPINGTIDSITHTTINATFNLTQAIAGDWSLYVINPDGQTSTAKTFAVGSLFMSGTPESFINSTGNSWVNHSWNAGVGDITDSYNVSYNGNWQNGTANSFNHTGLSAHAWSNITVYAYNATDSTLSAGASDNVRIPNNTIAILNVTDITVSEGENVTFDINFTDADGDTPTFDCNRSSLFDSFNTSTGEGVWTTDISDAGSYYIKFNVSDGYGSFDSQVMHIIINDTIIPVANFSANTVTGYAPLSVQFTDNSSNIPAAWFWDFGDGTNSTEQNPVIHTYNVAGIYNVSLNASNFAGSNLSSNLSITVTTAPSSGSSGSGGGSGNSGKLSIREVDGLDEPEDSISEDNTEGKSTENIGSVSFETDTGGETLGDITAWSSEKTARLSVSAGTKVTDASGGSVHSIRIRDIPASAVPAATGVPDMDSAITLQSYECTPDGTTFSPAIQLTFELSEEEWEQYGESAKVGWYNDDTGQWEIIQGTADASARTISIQVSHFSKYALFGADTSEPVTETQDAETQSGMSMSWLWMLLLLAIVGGAGYYVTQVKKKE